MSQGSSTRSRDEFRDVAASKAIKRKKREKDGGSGRPVDRQYSFLFSFHFTVPSLCGQCYRWPMLVRGKSNIVARRGGGGRLPGSHTVYTGLGENSIKQTRCTTRFGLDWMDPWTSYRFDGGSRLGVAQPSKFRDVKSPWERRADRIR